MTAITDAKQAAHQAGLASALSFKAYDKGQADTRRKLVSWVIAQVVLFTVLADNNDLDQALLHMHNLGDVIGASEARAITDLARSAYPNIDQGPNGIAHFSRELDEGLQTAFPRSFRNHRLIGRPKALNASIWVICVELRPID